jgi:iron complex outermembrane receptor protein
MRTYRFVVCAVLACVLPSSALAQGGAGRIRGTVTLEGRQTPMHNVSLQILQLRRTVETAEDGTYVFENVPPGRYDVLAHMDRFPDLLTKVTVPAGGEAVVDFEMALTTVSEEVTVTASGQEESALEAFQTVTTLDSIELTQKAVPGLGEVLEDEPGVAKRAFGPGSSRPVIRGFDGDRVLVLQDGIGTGSLSSQSGDHGETVNVLSLDTVEVVKGPATLLYGSNAIGGVVNLISGHDQIHDHPHEGLRGYFSTTAGTTNGLAGANAGFEYGYKNWLFWGNGGGIRTGDYDSPAGEVPNSKSRTSDAGAGLGWFGDRSYFTFGYSFEDGRYGVPFAATFEGEGEGEDETIDLTLRKHGVRAVVGMRDLDAFVTGFRLTLNYTDYNHRELEGDEVGTTFDNDVASYRLVFDQKATGRFSGSFGVSGLHRDYRTVGAEALAPPVKQNVVAAFALEEVDLDRLRLQFGGRVEHTGYNPDGLAHRSFTGASGAAGVHVPLWEGGAFVANLTSSFRAPALEELYNLGPHVGNLTFEVGNAGLERERSNGVDLSLRHASERVRGQANFYLYRIGNFVYLAPTGEVEDNLRVARYAQGDGRFLGGELVVGVKLNDYLWLNLGADAVDAELEDGTSLPRIPPARAHAGLEITYKGLSVKPEVSFVRDQDSLFPTETRTAGYTVFDVDASYTLAQQHVAHIFSVSAFNLGDRLYRNHLSFIKDLAPEIGRGVRVAYAVRFF